MATLKELFEARILVTPGCWIWQGTMPKPSKKLAYGRLKHKGKQLKAHRVSFELYIGPIPDGLFVLHKCDNPRCVNPDHLFTGDHDDNMADKVSKGRQASGVGITGNRISAYGEWHGRALLTEADVLHIRAIADSHHHYGRADLAQKYGVSESAIKAIKSRKLWKHLK